MRCPVFSRSKERELQAVRQRFWTEVRLTAFSFHGKEV